MWGRDFQLFALEKLRKDGVCYDTRGQLVCLVGQWTLQDHHCRCSSKMERNLRTGVGNYGRFRTYGLQLPQFLSQHGVEVHRS